MFSVSTTEFSFDKFFFEKVHSQNINITEHGEETIEEVSNFICLVPGCAVAGRPLPDFRRCIDHIIAKHYEYSPHQTELQCRHINCIDKISKRIFTMQEFVRHVKSNHVEEGTSDIQESEDESKHVEDIDSIHGIQNDIDGKVLSDEEVTSQHALSEDLGIMRDGESNAGTESISPSHIEEDCNNKKPRV